MREVELEKFYRIEIWQDGWKALEPNYDGGLGDYIKYYIAETDALRMSRETPSAFYRVVECSRYPRVGFIDGVLLPVDRVSGAPDYVKYIAQIYRYSRWVVLSSWNGKESQKAAMDFLQHESEVQPEDVFIRLIKTSSPRKQDSILYGYQGGELLPASLVSEPDRLSLALDSQSIDGRIF